MPRGTSTAEEGSRMWIMVAGPYRSGSSDPRQWARNAQALNRAALAVFRKGHVPIVGINLALPIVEAAGEDAYAELMLPLSLAAASRCDAVLRIGGPSEGADREVEVVQKSGRPVYRALDEVPDGN